jgi:hypothetical protein
MTRQRVPPPPDEEREPTIDPHDPSRADKWGYSESEIFVVIPGLKAKLAPQGKRAEAAGNARKPPRQHRSEPTQGGLPHPSWQLLTRRPRCCNDRERCRPNASPCRRWLIA